MQISVRQATADDAALLAELCQAVQEIHVAAHPNIFKPLRADDPELIEFYVSRLADGNIIYIAEVDSAGVGYILCQLVTRPENVFSYGQSRLYIDQMSVNAAYRSKGVGKRLMEKAFELAREHDVQVVTLSVWAFNEQAQRFYAANGFENAHHTMWVKLDKQ
jgi:ribosomal protein S18 acetylase RimI-like enzyme